MGPDWWDEVTVHRIWWWSPTKEYLTHNHSTYFVTNQRIPCHSHCHFYVAHKFVKTQIVDGQAHTKYYRSKRTFVKCWFVLMCSNSRECWSEFQIAELKIVQGNADLLHCAIVKTLICCTVQLWGHVTDWWNYLQLRTDAQNPINKATISMGGGGVGGWYHLLWLDWHWSTSASAVKVSSCLFLFINKLSGLRLIITNICQYL